MGEELEQFARIDGFSGWQTLRRFWAENHPEIVDAWEGIQIGWSSTFKAPSDGAAA